MDNWMETESGENKIKQYFIIGRSKRNCCVCLLTGVNA